MTGRDWLADGHSAEWTCACGEISKTHLCGDGGNQPWTVNDDGTIQCPCGFVVIVHRCAA
jgi:hypothetical protein